MAAPILVVIVVPTAIVVGAFLWRLRRHWRNRDINASEIDVEITDVTDVLGKKRGSLTLRANGRVFFQQPEMMLTELAEQLEVWATKVDDVNACWEFSFAIPNDPKSFGLFRFIPRQVGWQFHSIRSKMRPVPLPLDVHVRVAAAIIKSVR